MKKPLQRYRTSPAMWNHTMLPATQHKMNTPCLNLTKAGQADTWFTYPGRM